MHARLRAQTHFAHKSLDQCEALVSLLSPNLNIDTYARLLCAMQVWFSEAETLTQAIKHENIELQHIKDKGALLSEDINALNYNLIKTNTTNANTTPALLSSINNKFAVLGLLYVVEGSTLGGMVIAPKVQRALAREDVTSFYECYDEQKLAFFNKTMLAIKSAVTSEKEAEEVVAGALDSFASLQHWIEKTWSYELQQRSTKLT